MIETRKIRKFFPAIKSLAIQALKDRGGEEITWVVSPSQ